MSNTRKALAFLFLTFAISLTALAIAWQQGMREMLGNSNPPAVFQIAIFGPGIAAIICTLAFERGQRFKALGLRLIPNQWWIGALLLPALFGAILIATNLTLDGKSLLDADAWAAAVAAMATSKIIGNFPNLATALLVMIVVNTLTEELGWRGYLHHLLRPSGFLAASLVPGIAQGIWHWPLVILFGLGTGNTLADMAFYPVFTAVLGIYLTLFRERGASVLAAGIFHGTYNIVASDNAGAAGYIVFAIMGLGAVAIVYGQRRSLKNSRNIRPASASPMPE